MTKKGFTNAFAFIVLISILTSCFQKKDAVLIDAAQASAQKISDRINSLLEGIRAGNEKTALIAKALYLSPQVPLYSKSIYSRDSSGVLGDHGHQSKSSLYINKSIQESELLNKFIAITEHLESTWMTLRESLPVIGWQYIVDAATAAERSYPWHNEAELFGNKLDFKSFDFYYELVPSKNEYNQSKWLKPTNDLAGLGWIVSVSSPIIEGNQFLGVQVIDVPIRNLMKQHEAELSNGNGVALILDQQKNIIAETACPKIYAENTNEVNIVEKIKDSIKEGRIGDSGHIRVGGTEIYIAKRHIRETNWDLYTAMTD